MLPKPLSLRSARHQWHENFNSLLSKAQVYQVTRLITQGDRAGITEVVNRVSKPYSTGCKDTGALLIKRALDTIYQLREVQFLQLGETDELPAGVVIEVNCVELGKKRSLSARTIRTHLQQLREAGLILTKKFHGWRRNLELVISSKYLFKMVRNKQNSGPNEAVLQLITGTDASPYGTKFPPIKEQNRLLISTPTTASGKVENNAAEPKKAVSTPPGGANGADAAGDEARPEIGKTGLGARFSGPKSTPKPAASQASAEAKKAAVLARFCEELFTKACKMLYPRVRFQAHEFELALEAIAEGVYRHLDADFCDPSLWEVYHAGCLERVRLASNYYANHTEYKVQWPYSLYSNQQGYFDAENPMGFIRTLAWHEKNEKKRAEKRVEYALTKAENEFHQFKQRARGLDIKCPKRVKEMSAWELFRWHETRVKVAGGRPALERFYRLTNVRLQPASANPQA